MTRPSPFPGPGDLLAQRYRLRREIGRGGYSVVYAARDTDLEVDVAVKLLVPPPAAAPLARERMRREVQLARQLSHANIVAVFDFVEEGGWSAVVMELVDGPDLEARVRLRGPLAATEAGTLGWEVATALSVAHRRGVLHRDVKPQNILLSEGGAKLTDFGSARLDGQAAVTLTGGLVGTLSYAAPELVAGGRGDARADVYALGVTLHFALTGELPARGSPHLPPPPEEGGYRPRNVRPGVPEWLDDAVARATSASPSARFATAAELADTLARRGTGACEMAWKATGATHACVLCRAPDPLALGVCPRCGGTSDAAADTLVFVRRAGARTQIVARQALASVIGAAADGAAGRTAAAGERALLRVPATAATRVVEQLDLRDIPAVALPASRAWTMIPAPFLAMVAAVVGLGAVAGSVAAPALLWTSPLVAVLLILSAERSVRDPILAAPPQVRRLPTGAERPVTRTLAELPPGEARNLLADVVRVAQVLHEALARDGDAGSVTPALTELLEAACASALDVGRLDAGLAALEPRSEGRTGAAPSPSWLDVLARCERARDERAQQLLDALTVLGRLYAQALEAPGSAAARLSEATSELRSEARARAAAAAEIEALLGSAGAPVGGAL